MPDDEFLSFTLLSPRLIVLFESPCKDGCQIGLSPHKQADGWDGMGWDGMPSMGANATLGRNVVSSLTE